jgi:hypothetical protein
MRFYLDTEFNGHGGELISMALVSELTYMGAGVRGSIEWYGARRIKSPIAPWVAENVMPVLSTRQLSPEDFRSEFGTFISRYENCQIICDWHTDAEHFCAMLAGRDYGSSLDFPCMIRILKTPPGEPAPAAIPHNALHDARTLRDWHEAQLLAA